MVMSKISGHGRGVDLGRLGLERGCVTVLTSSVCLISKPFQTLNSSKGISIGLLHNIISSLIRKRGEEGKRRERGGKERR